MEDEFEEALTDLVGRYADTPVNEIVSALALQIHVLMERVNS